MKREITFKSHDNKSTIHGLIWVPNVPIKGIIQVLHNTINTIESYENLSNMVSDDGYAICGIDMLGFGKSIESPDKQGYIADKKDALNILIEDENTFKEKILEEFKDIPFFVLGDGLLSSLAKLYVNKYPNNIDGLILVGPTYKRNFISDRIYCNIRSLHKTWYEKNYHILKKYLNEFHKQFEDKNLFTWLNSNQDKISNKNEDTIPRLTLNGYIVLFNIISKSNRKKYLSNTKLPILIMSGKDDPIGHFSKDIYTIEEQYKKLNVKEIKTKLFNGMRHDLLNENYNDLVIDEILKFTNLYRNSVEK